MKNACFNYGLIGGRAEMLIQAGKAGPSPSSGHKWIKRTPFSIDQRYGRKAQNIFEVHTNWLKIYIQEYFLPIMTLFEQIFMLDVSSFTL